MRGLLSRREWAVLALGFVVLTFLTWQVTTAGEVVRLDQQWFRAIGTSTSPFVLAISDVGSAEVSGLVLVVAAVHSAFTRGLWWPVVLAAGNGLGMTVIVLAMKAITARDGPGSPQLDGHRGFFPSGHTSAAAVCFGTACYIVLAVRRLPRVRHGRSGSGSTKDVPGLGMATGLGVGAVVGTMTVISGNHWVSDAVAGLALASMVLTIGFAVARWHLGREYVSAARRSLMT